MGLAWHERIAKVLKANEVRLVTYIPDNALAPLIGAVHADPWFKAICPAGEEEAAGIVAVARGAGLGRSEWARDESHFESLVDRALRESGPGFIGARIDGASPAGVTERDPARIRQRFMDALCGKA